mgnify:CR=1 FL=1
MLSRDQLIERLKSVKLLSLDVDGVLTDGGLYYAEDGLPLRKFNVKDGLGMKRAMEAGVEVAIVSAATMASIHHRGEFLGIRHVFTAVADKLETVGTLCQELGISLAEVAHVGDDLNDIPLMGQIGCPLTVAGAVPEVLGVAAYVTERPGGEGAVREICDLLVASRGG